MQELTLCFLMNSSSSSHGASRTTSSTYLQCLTASYLSKSVITVLPFLLCVSSSLHTIKQNAIIKYIRNIHRFTANLHHLFLQRQELNFPHVMLHKYLQQLDKHLGKCFWLVKVVVHVLDEKDHKYHQHRL